MFVLTQLLFGSRLSELLINSVLLEYIQDNLVLVIIISLSIIGILGISVSLIVMKCLSKSKKSKLISENTSNNGKNDIKIK